MKKFWNWLTEDFDKGYEQEPLLPSTLKEWLIVLGGGFIGLVFLTIFIYSVHALEGIIYGF